MSFLSQFAGGGGALSFHRALASSGSFVSPRRGRLLIFALAGGGGGRGGGKRGTGGGAGECAFDTIQVNAGDSFTVTIGAGGAPGSAGGNTTITGPNSYSLTVVGGDAGQFSDTAVAVNGGTGGTGGTGGSANVYRLPGGRGGNIASTGAGVQGTGGGAVNLFGLGSNICRGGDILASWTVGNGASTGGGGIGGSGGDIVSYASGPAAANSGGGGSGGAAASGTSVATSWLGAGGPNYFGEASANAPTAVFSSAQPSVLLGFINYLGGGGNGGNSTTPGGGGGAGAGGTATVGGIFGGGGGRAGNDSVNPLNASSGGRGGGGGGCSNDGGAGAGGGSGGAGLVVFALLEG